jgi:hypothetical protein
MQTSDAFIPLGQMVLVIPVKVTDVGVSRLGAIYAESDLGHQDTAD